MTVLLCQRATGSAVGLDKIMQKQSQRFLREVLFVRPVLFCGNHRKWKTYSIIGILSFSLLHFTNCHTFSLPLQDRNFSYVKHKLSNFNHRRGRTLPAAM